MVPWQRECSATEFWKLAEREHTAEHTTRRVSYVRRVLEESAPGRRVVDVGCGLGWCAIGLAQAGFEVTGLDMSEWAIDEARRRGTVAGVDVRWEVLDLLAGNAWPLTTVDAAIYMHWFGWGSDVIQRRLLRQIRQHLVDSGVLIVERPPGFCPADNSSRFDDDMGVRTCEFKSGHGPKSDQTMGSMRLSTSGKLEKLVRPDVRLYSTVEFTSLVRQAGFAAERLDADLTPQLPVSSPSSTTTLVARPLPVPPRSLAVASWRTPPTVRLDLRYAPDEAELLDPSPSHVWEELILSVACLGADLVASYPVDDLYGGERGAEVVGDHFDCSVVPSQLTFAAGVSSLLHTLCGLADGGLIVAPELVHPDLEAWAIVRGNEIRLIPEPATRDQLVAEIDDTRPALLHLDRPTFTGQLIPLNELEAVARTASGVGAVLVIDESPAPYIGPAGSAARLVNQVDNLVVLRGFTKAYSWGGLRAAFALASHGVASRVRELVAPLQVGELAFHGVLRLLAAGDIFGPLRARIHAAKPATVELLETLGLEVIEGHQDLPWVVVSDAAGAASRILDHCGIRGLRPTLAPTFPRIPNELLRLTIPLSHERMALFRQLISGVPESARGGVPKASAAMPHRSAPTPDSSRSNEG
jgi:histidinol-phosphate/aromatic aminotransferase/cobyric acid decarboxylase-like protein/SAM-dependent methyltransferase